MITNTNINEDTHNNSSLQNSNEVKDDSDNSSHNNFDMENEITAMLDKVLDEKDIEIATKSVTTDLDSLQFIEEEDNEDEEYSVHTPRNANKHQTSIPLNMEKSRFKNFREPNINRVSKRYQTVNCNQTISNAGLNESKFLNNNNNNVFLYQNYPQNNASNFRNNVDIKNQMNLNNYPLNQNQQMQFTQMVNNANCNFIRNNFPSKTVVYHFNQNKDFFNINNNPNSSIYGYNINNVNINTNMKNMQYNLKRGDKRKNTYDIPLCFTVNKKNFNIQNINNSEYNNQYFGFNNIPYQPNEIIMNNNNNYNNNYSNIISQLNPVNSNTTITDDSKIQKLKTMLEKSGKIDHYIYNIIKGKILSILKNHKGSRIFQKYLKSTHCDILHQIFVELSFNLDELFTNPYANYFCKKFFTYLSQKDRAELLKSIEKSIVKYSCDSVGTFTIQTIIEHVGSKSEKIIIASAIKEHVKELSFDPFGTYVLERLLTYFEEEYISFIYSYITDNFTDLACDNNGIVVIKKIITFTHKKALHDKIKNIIKENVMSLIKHPYASVLMQVIIESWPDYKDIIDLYEDKYLLLSTDKYASNVVERCLEKDQNILNKYIDDIINSEKIHEVMKSNYGNYVIQKAIKLATGEYKEKIVENAAKNVNKLNDPKLIIKWKSILMPYIKEIGKDNIKVFVE